MFRIFLDIRILFRIGLLQIFGMGLAFLQAVILSRVFGPEIFGFLSVAISVTTIMVLVVGLGFDQYIIREVSARGLEAAAADPNFRGDLRFLGKIVLCLVAFASVSGIFVFSFLGYGGGYRWPLLTASAALGFLSLRKLTDSVAVSVKKPSLSMISNSLAFPSVMILGALAIQISTIPKSAASVSVLYFIAVLVSVITSALLIRRHLFALRLLGASELTEPRRVIKSALNLGLVTSAYMISDHMDTILLGILSSPAEAGLGRIAWRLAELVAFARIIAMIYYKPLLSESYAQDRLEMLARHTKFMSVFMGVGAIIFCLPLFFFSEEVLAFFGPEFADARLALLAYTVASLAMILAGPVTMLLAMTGFEKECARYLWISLAINLVLDLFLIPLYGALGAGLATAISKIILAVRMGLLCRTHLQLNPNFFATLVGRTKVPPTDH